MRGPGAEKQHPVRSGLVTVLVVGSLVLVSVPGQAAQEFPDLPEALEFVTDGDDHHQRPVTKTCKGGEEISDQFTGETIAWYEACVKTDGEQCKAEIMFMSGGAYTGVEYRFDWEGEMSTPSTNWFLDGSRTYTASKHWDLVKFFDTKVTDPPVSATVELAFTRQEVDETRDFFDDRAKLSSTKTVTCE